jgi:hypothetical protein
MAIAGQIVPESDNGPTISPPPSPLTPERVFEILDDAGASLFCDQYDNAFAALPWDRPGDHLECMPIKTKKFRQRLHGLVQNAANTKASAAFLRQMVQELELRCEGATPVKLHNRMASGEDGIRIDLGDDLWRTILITRKGYSLIQDREPRFYRSKHQQPLPEPVAAGDPQEILTYIPVENESDGLLLLTWTVAALNPAIPTPMLIFTGQQGSAKTTRCRRLRSLIDPSLIPVLEDAGDRDLVQILYHHAVPCFENVSSFDRKRADIFCRAVTGSGVERRRLYTDMDEVIFDFRRPILMNGIDIPSTRPDFLDRCLILPCTRIAEFQSGVTLDAEFEQARPRLLGSILTLLVRTLNLLESTPSTGEFRMADFAHFGQAVARALGHSAEAFDVAYRANLAQQNRDLVEDSPFARAITEFAKSYCEDAPWEGNAETLRKHAIKTAKEKSIRPAGEGWPKSARWVSSQLSELTPALAIAGVVVERLKRQNNCRPWRVYCREDDGGPPGSAVASSES